MIILKPYVRAILLKTEVSACANLALIKYWGNVNSGWNIPENDSISVSLEKLNSVTSVEFGTDHRDTFILNDREVAGEQQIRFKDFLTKFRMISGFDVPVHVESSNNFPTSAGIASSASGYGAMAHGFYENSGLAYTPSDVSKLARLGSGSAARTVHPGYAHWLRGTDHDTSYSVQLAPPNDLRILIAITSRGEKHISSSKAMEVSKHKSPFYHKRAQVANENIEPLAKAIKSWDFDIIGTIAQQESNNLHAVINTTDLGLSYWNPTTIKLLDVVRKIQLSDVSCYYSMDAGPQVKILVEKSNSHIVLKEIDEIDDVEYVINSGVGFGSKVMQ